MALKEMGSCEYVNEQACKQTSLKINARYFFGNTLALGDITNITDCCMCISTKYCIPLNSIIKLFVPYKTNVLDIPVRVSRYLNRDSLHDVMCVEVNNLSTEYLEFFNSIEQRMCWAFLKSCIFQPLIFSFPYGRGRRYVGVIIKKRIRSACITLSYCTLVFPFCFGTQDFKW